MKSVAILMAVLVGGIGVGLIFFTAPTAEADSLSIKNVSVDVSQIHQNARSVPAPTTDRTLRAAEHAT
jgi:hypothetical protein